MRLLFVNDTLVHWGGLERVLIEKANYFADVYGYDVSIVTVDQGNHSVPYLISDSVNYYDMGINFHKQYLYPSIARFFINSLLHNKFRKKLCAFYASFYPDVIISMRVDFISDILRTKCDIPLIVESHACCNNCKYEKSGILRKIKSYRLNLLTKRANTVVSLTEGDAKDWKHYTTNVKVIPNFVHLNMNGRLCDYTSKNAIFVGRLEKQKDPMVLLEIWSIVGHKYPEWCLNIFGEGSLRKDVVDMAVSLKLNVRFNDPTSSIMDRYVENSMFLLTSYYEPFGLVLPEAMSCGLPVVAFDCPYGPADIITDGVDGFLIKNRDVNEFARRVCQLIESYDLRCQMGKAGIESSQRYNADRIMPQWVNLFEELTSSRAK